MYDILYWGLFSPLHGPLFLGLSQRSVCGNAAYRLCHVLQTWTFSLVSRLLKDIKAWSTVWYPTENKCECCAMVPALNGGLGLIVPGSKERSV